jgi:hypothetical protein
MALFAVKKAPGLAKYFVEFFNDKRTVVSGQNVFRLLGSVKNTPGKATQLLLFV